uniref:N-acetyltransferase domain-containing protein n=1 Tax=Octactis speculum TaxID=3111310 RepID=A0A7S2HE16_9STRA
MGLGGRFACGQHPLLFLTLLRANVRCSLNAENICIRLARKDDIPGIQRCNLKTLPENYAISFYSQHLSNWPHIALVAEELPAPPSPGTTLLYPRKGEVVGYVLGRMETGTSKAGLVNRMTRHGHITSLAVMPDFRRLGLAQQMMEKVHSQMRLHYSADKSSLHVRITNEGAVRLYQNSLGYETMQVIGNYYSDGEDAFLMTASLANVETQTEENPMPRRQVEISK